MFISRHTLKWTKTCRSSGDFPHAHTAHFLLNRHRAAFCAKEAASKALSALDGTGDFRKVSVSLKADGTFAAVRRDVALRGQWRFYDRLVSAMVAVPSETI